MDDYNVLLVIYGIVSVIQILVLPFWLVWWFDGLIDLIDNFV